MPGRGKTCNKCQKKNHFAAVCKTKARGNPRNPKTLNSLTHSSTSTVLYENGEDLQLDETLFSVTKVTEGGNLRALKDENSRSVVAREKSNARALAVNENKDFDAVILVEGIKVSFLVARKSCLSFPFYPKNTTRKLEGKESQVQPKKCLDFEFGS